MKPATDPAEVARFRDLVLARTGMAFPRLTAAELGWAIQRATAETDASDPSALYQLLAGPAPSRRAMDALIGALNVSETYFFRDADQIRSLEEHILPDLISRRRLERRLRLWSAGCSTGEEAYTLAILVTRLLADLARWDVLILATDLNGRSLETARRGDYGAWSLRGASPAALTSYLTPSGRRFEVVPSIRAMVTFAQLNLADDDYPSGTTNTLAMDLVLCRNVLLYFEQESGRAVMGRLRKALTDDGRILVSQVEAGLSLFDGLAQDAPGTAIYRKVPRVTVNAGPDLAPPAQPARAGASPARLTRPRPARSPRRILDGGVGDDVPVSAQLEALRLWRTGHPDTALERLETSIKSNPLAAPLHYLHGLILIDAERTDEALVAFRQCTYADPEFALGHLAQAHLLAGLGLRSRAQAPLETSARLMANLAPDAVVLQGDGLTVGDVLELIAAQRDLLAASDPPDVTSG